jgi:predicted glycosyltransferase
MRVWIDFANSPHVALFEPVVERLRAEQVALLLTARDHAQTLGLARRAFGDVSVVGGESPPGKIKKGLSIADRARTLYAFARASRPDVALSHGSYAQVLAARAAGVPAVTMMDYEFQPANHVSFRLARRLIVPMIFPADALRRFGASERKIVRYDGFKEELYLGRFQPDDGVLSELALDPSRSIAVMRLAPEGALYHGFGNERFERLLDDASARADVQVVVLPRVRAQAARYAGRSGVIVPEQPVDGRSLLAHADLMIGAGGTMNREAALLGTPTYTVFAGRLAAVDAELMRRGLLRDLRQEGIDVTFTKKPPRDPALSAERADRILERILETVAAVTAAKTSSRN